MTYSVVGATAVAENDWREKPVGFRHFERTVPIAVEWEEARNAVLHWGVKTRSGFLIDGSCCDVAPVAVERDVWVGKTVGGFHINEPIRGVAAIDTPLRCGFAYGTLDGHPVNGEEAFIVHRSPSDGTVLLTIRSLTRPAQHGMWRFAFPVVLAAQWFFRRRYLAAFPTT